MNKKLLLSFMIIVGAMGKCLASHRHGGHHDHGHAPSHTTVVYRPTIGRAIIVDNKRQLTSGRGFYRSGNYLRFAFRPGLRYDIVNFTFDSAFQSFNYGDYPITLPIYYNDPDSAPLLIGRYGSEYFLIDSQTDIPIKLSAVDLIRLSEISTGQIPEGILSSRYRVVRTDGTLRITPLLILN